MAIAPWLPILQWREPPNFTNVHNLAWKRFRNLYHQRDPKWRGFIANLWEGLMGENPPTAVRIESPPGWGKTSCFYFLSQISEEDHIKRHLHVLHTSNIIGPNGLDSSAAADACFQALVKYFEKCSPDKHYADDITRNEDITIQQKINVLVEYLKKNKQSFSKRLVFIIDDVDIILERHVLGAVEAIFRMLQAANIIKWLAIRGVTYQTYSLESKRQLNTLFPACQQFPQLDLYDIATLRVEEVKEPGGINPFSPRLCSHIQSLYLGDHREGLATLEEILQDSNPGKIEPEKVSEEWIQKYMERMALKALMRHDAIPNLFIPMSNSNIIIPLCKEVLGLLFFYREIDSKFLSLINDSLSRKITNINGQVTQANIKAKEIYEATQGLSKLGVIRYQSNSNITITERGLKLQQYLDQEYYINLCRDALKDVQEDVLFWRLAFVKSDYRAILMEAMFGEDLDPI